MQMGRPLCPRGLEEYLSVVEITTTGQLKNGESTNGQIEKCLVNDEGEEGKAKKSRISQKNTLR